MIETLEQLEPGMTVSFPANPDIVGWLLVDQVSRLGSLTAVWLHDPQSPATADARCVILVLDSCDSVIVA